MAVRTTSAITQVDHIGTALLTFPTRTTGAIVSRTTSARVTTATALPADSTILPAPTRTVTPITRTTSVLTSTTPTVLATAVRPITPTVRSASTLTQSVSDPTILATPSGVAAPPATRATSLLSQSQSANAFVAPVVTSPPPTSGGTTNATFVSFATDTCQAPEPPPTGGLTDAPTTWNPSYFYAPFSTRLPTGGKWVVPSAGPWTGFTFTILNPNAGLPVGVIFFVYTGDLCGSYTGIGSTWTATAPGFVTDVSPPGSPVGTQILGQYPPNLTTTFTATFASPVNSSSLKVAMYAYNAGSTTIPTPLQISTVAFTQSGSQAQTSATTGYTLASPTIYATPKRVPSQSTAPTRFRRRWWWRW